MEQILSDSNDFEIPFDADPDEGAFRTIWIMRRRDFEDGQVEASIVPSTRWKRFEPSKPPVRRRRSESDEKLELSEDNEERSVRRSRVAVRHRCRAISADYMVTLTVRENVDSIQQFKKMFDTFRRRLSKVENMTYVAVPERQQRGAWHVHMAVHGRQNLRVLRSIWQSVCGGPGQGSVNIRSPFKEKNLRHRLASYLSKYLGKSFGDDAFGARRYWSTRGIVVPEAWETAILEGAHRVADALAHGVRQLLGRDCSYFYDKFRASLYIHAGPLLPDVVVEDCPF